MANSLIETQKVDRRIIKSNNLIESSYRLTILENRLIYYAVTKLKTIMINKSLTAEEVADLINHSKFDLIEINVIDFQKEFGLKSKKMYEELILASEKLFERRIVYINEKGNITKKRWVITCRYELGEGKIFLQFHPDLISDLLVLKNKFTIFKLDNCKDIKSIYACRLYELLRQYGNIGYRTFTVDNFRFLLGLEENEYERYCNLKQRVINTSLKEINTKTDLSVELEETKVKNKVIKLHFKIYPKKVVSTQKKQLSFLDEYESVWENLLASNNIIGIQKCLDNFFGVYKRKKIINEASKIIEDTGFNTTAYDYIKEKAQIIYEYNKSNVIDNEYALLLKAIRENYNTNANKNDHKKVVMGKHTPNNFNDFPQKSPNNYFCGVSISELADYKQFGTTGDIEKDKILESVAIDKKCDKKYDNDENNNLDDDIVVIDCVGINIDNE